jgi:hypothetical protein
MTRVWVSLWSATRILERNLLAILNSFVDEGRKITADEIRVILHPKYFEEIDLNPVAALWK